MDKQLIEQLMAMGGSAAQRLLAGGMNVNALRTNATLRKDEWIQLDEAIIQAAQLRLVGVADLVSRGLVYNISNGLGKTILESENVGDMRAAELSMDGVTRGQNDAVNYEIVGLPLPLIHKEYSISIRKLNASRERGESLDVTQAALSGRKVAELVEDILFNGYGTYAYGGYNLYGYLNLVGRNTASVTAAWASASGANIIADVMKMKQALINDHMYGPYMIYVPTDVETNLDADYSTSKGENTIRDRIMKVSGILGVRVADKMPSGHVLMVQMTPDVVRMVNALPITNVEWQSAGNMIFNFKVMTIQVPQLRLDQDGHCGIVELS